MKAATPCADWAPLYLISKLRKGSTTWKNVDERVKNALSVDDTGNLSFLDYHVTLYHMIVNPSHPDSKIFSDPSLISDVQQIYKNIFCSRPGLKLHSDYGEYKLFPFPTQQNPTPFPRFLV